MSDVWYTIVSAEEPLTQGDLIPDCPLIAWAPGPIELRTGEEAEALKAATFAIQADVVVMTQACDLEHDKVPNIILCPHLGLSEYRAQWEAEMRGRGQNPTEKSWRVHCEDIREGFVWNLAILNPLQEGPLTVEHRVVDFHDVFTIRGYS